MLGYNQGSGFGLGAQRAALSEGYKGLGIMSPRRTLREAVNNNTVPGDPLTPVRVKPRKAEDEDNGNGDEKGAPPISAGVHHHHYYPVAESRSRLRGF
jgi:hypothetical protein